MIVLRNIEVCAYFISSSIKINLSIYLGTLNIFPSNATIGTCLSTFSYIIYKGETPAHVILA